MKSRICIIGNSHAAALKFGWQLAPDVAAAFEPTFLAAGAYQLADSLQIDGHRLVLTKKITNIARRSDGVTEVDTRDYDLFLFVGLLLRMRNVVEIYETHRLAQHADASHQIISPEALRRAAYGALIDTPACLLLTRARQITSAPCMLVPDPFPSLDAKTQPKTGHLWNAGFTPYLHDLYRECLQRIAKEKNVPVVSQPNDMIADGYFSPIEYATDSPMLRPKFGEPNHPEGEVYHMNAGFGARMLRHIFQQIPARRGQAVQLDQMASTAVN